MRRASDLSSFPLATRTRLAREAARFAAASVLLALLMAIVTPDTMNYPFGLMLSVLAFPLAVQLTVAFAPLGRMSERLNELMLQLLAATSVASVFGSVLALPNENGVGFAFTGFALMLAAVTLRTRDTFICLIISTIAGLLSLQLLPNPSAGFYVLLPGLLVGLIAGYWAHLHSVSMREMDAARIEAMDAMAALGAVVAGARESTGREPSEVLQAVADATALLGAHTAGVYVIDEDGMLAFGAQHGPLASIANIPLRPGQGLLGDIIRAGETVLVRDYPAYADAVASFVELGISSAMGTPIALPDGTMLGVLVMGQVDDGPGFSSAAVDALELLAQHAAGALQLSREVDEDRRTLRALSGLIDRQRDFVATASHELRTPVTVIDGLADTLVRHADSLDEEQRGHILARLVSNTTMLRTIVESLLDIASLERGLTVGDEQVDLGLMCANAVERLGPLLAEHHVEVSVDADTVVRGDESLLARVVDNLLANAQRHTPAGTKVTVSVRRTGRRVDVEVADDGPGIPADVLPRITERFVRAGDHHTRESRGLGIGLALAEQVLRLHGTTLDVTSTVGEGSTFGFRLLHADAGAQDPAAELPGRPLSRGRPS